METCPTCNGDKIIDLFGGVIRVRCKACNGKGEIDDESNSVLARVERPDNLLEAALPGNPDAPKNLKLAAKMEASLQGYFRDLEQAIPWGDIEKIYNRHANGD